LCGSAIDELIALMHGRIQPPARLLAAIAVAIALLAVPGAALAQQEGSAFGPLAPTVPSEEPQQPQAPGQSQLPPVMPFSEPTNGPLSMSEMLVFLVIEALLLGAIAVAIAREGGGLRRRARRQRHARRARPPARNRGATHLTTGAKAPPPPPRRRRPKAARARAARA
jgi:hypothetical protein